MVDLGSTFTYQILAPYCFVIDRLIGDCGISHLWRFLEPQSTSVASGVRSCPKNPGWRMSVTDGRVPPVTHCDDLSPPKLRPLVAFDGPVDFVAPSLQLLSYFLVNAVLQIYNPLMSCLIKLDKNSWGIQSLLRIHPKLQHV